MKFCYWSVADGDHGKMFKTVISSARRCGVNEDFHIYTDINIPGAILHETGRFSKDHYLFKLEFLNRLKELDYDYFVWLDADTFFVRHPGDFRELLRGNKWFVQMESDCTSKFVQRGDWWGCPMKWYILLMRYYGITHPRVYNCNAGFWMVRKESIDEFYKTSIDFFKFCREELHLINFTEEPALALVGHFVDNVELNTFTKTSHIWASDWSGVYKNRLPDGDDWYFRDYMTGEKHKVNPAIVHCMRSKKALINGYNIKWKH